MNRENVLQTVKFCTVGLINTCVDYVIFFVMVAAVNTDKSVAQILATAGAMCGSYFMNKHWTFGIRGKQKKRQIAKFVATNMVSMCCTIILMSLFHDVFCIHQWANGVFADMGCTFRMNYDVGVMFCKVIASCLSFIINFVGNKFWVFKDYEEQQNN
ncbi:MAG: GtrA family protein [Clostridia bacterium]|nr:GtrA family protein [Clostridia bacterium]